MISSVLLRLFIYLFNDFNFITVVYIQISEENKFVLAHKDIITLVPYFTVSIISEEHKIPLSEPEEHILPT